MLGATSDGGDSEIDIQIKMTPTKRAPFIVPEWLYFAMVLAVWRTVKADVDQDS